MTKHYDLLLWTAGIQSYADPIVDLLDPEQVIFSKLMYCTACTELADGRCVKDLKNIQVALSRVLILDNGEKSYAFQPTNGISDFAASNLDTDFYCDAYATILRNVLLLECWPQGPGKLILLGQITIRVVKILVVFKMNSSIIILMLITISKSTRVLGVRLSKACILCSFTKPFIYVHK